MANLNICKQADDLEALLNYMESAEFVKGLSSGDDSQARTELDAATGMVHQSIATALVRLHRLYDNYQDRSGKEYRLDDLVPQLDDEELKRVGAMWDVERSIEDLAKAEAKIKRTNAARKGKRGRPVGS